MPELLEVENCVLAYDDIPVVKQVSFALETGSIGCLLGPSGCGKTTLLRAVAGFELLSSGEIRLRGQVVSHSGWALPPEQRRVGMVFQDFALFPHLTVAGNIAFGLRHLSERERRTRVRELLELVGMPGYASAWPHQLSGGQQQRIAVARAIAPRPELLLLDEPFSSMDAELREQLAREVRGILKQEAITAILVTHDQYEAFAMADEIGVINQGRLMQWDSGYNLYHRPANRFVADFIGQGAILTGEVLNEQHVNSELGIIPGRIPEGCAPGCKVDLLVRPDDIQHDDDSELRARVVEKAFRGAEFLYTLELHTGTRILCFAPSHHDHAIGEAIGIRLEIDHLVMFRQERQTT
ncbi:ABC transporter ATP-binding protein [Thiohalobacter thiocyanaticus]|uniref:ABC transporter ATP-binding protein n=1 Tax=Thiohalobacter thiocyanaticus TaxID=585455 RepID=A0A426QHZ7_9GAMM|nr:ABC transporter ATP-binding protein [Thiohalobacter thiocyanaticus]RRQ21372.1 ABC transporter ATP-binding protein [Thiohalobacter thiocyanaticus]